MLSIAVIAGAFTAGACSTESVVRNIEPGPRANGAVVFLAGSLPDYDDQLFSMEADGTRLRQLTDDLNQKTAVASSPNGAKLAYAAFASELTEESPAPEPSSIYVIEADGSGRQQLCHACARTAYALEPETGWNDTYLDGRSYAVPDSLAWSPTGSTLAAPAVTPGVLLIDVATGERTTIATPEPVTAIAWAHDGKRLALSHTWFIGQSTSLGLVVPHEGTLLEREPEDLPGGIYVLDLGSRDVDEVLTTPGLAHVHGWSPDGDRIALSHVLESGRAGEISVYSVSEDRMWTIVPGEQGAAPIGIGWSPSDDAIAALIDQYDEQAQLAKDFWVTPSTDVNLRALPICGFDGALDGDQCAKPAIAWSPDGTKVAYRAMLHGTPAKSAVVFQGIDGSSPEVALLDGASFDIGEGPCCLAWLPAP